MSYVEYEGQALLARFYKKFLASPEVLACDRGSVEGLRRTAYKVESEWMLAEECLIDFDTFPREKEEFIKWYLVTERKMNLDIRFFIEFLRAQASLKQIAYYICMEELVDGSFDDLMALVQLGMPIKPKMVAGRNYWDEMGGGDFRKVHTTMFKESSSYMREVLSDLDVSVERPTLECLMNGNMLLMWALRREYNVRLIGAIGLVEGSAPVRFQATTDGLERLKQPRHVVAYHKAHIEIDTHHSRAWLETVLDYYASCSGDVIREMAVGVAIRHNVALRYYHHMYSQMRALGDD